MIRDIILSTPYLIAIAGPSGSGKTTLASNLAASLPAACATIALDSYYLPLPDLSLDERALRNYDHPNALDWPLLHVQLETLLDGRAMDTPVYQFDQHTRASATRRIEPEPYLILEGILALHSPEIRRLADLKTFVVASPEACLTRRIERDIAERGRTLESVLEQFNTTVWPMALEFVLPTQPYADLTVSGEAPLEQSVEEVLRHAVRRFPRPRGGDQDL